MTPLGWSNPTYVYFLQPIGGGRIKIGASDKPNSRLKQYMDWSPVSLRTLAAVRAIRMAEHVVHRRFASLHWRGEWFEPSPELVAFVDQVASAGRLPDDICQEAARLAEDREASWGKGKRPPFPRLTRNDHQAAE